jgi:catechol 2,3-dioxygenase-like lactoylglutathione lyase family enzyme
MNSHLTFHHLGLAVASEKQALTFLSALGYEPGNAVYEPLQRVNLMMCTHASEPAVEIIWPGEGKSPVDGLIRRHAAGIVYHICYSTDDLAGALAGLEGQGIRMLCVSPPQPALLFGGRPVSFYQAAGVGLVEILE